VDKKTAAIYLLIDTWTFERDNMELDHFHWLDNVGLLSVAEFMAIGQVVSLLPRIIITTQYY